MKNGWKRWIRGWSLIVILLSVLSVSGCSVSEEDGLQEVTEKVSQEPEVSQKDSGKSEDQEKPGQTEGDTDTGSKKKCREEDLGLCMRGSQCSGSLRTERGRKII